MAVLNSIINMVLSHVQSRKFRIWFFTLVVYFATTQIPAIVPYAPYILLGVTVISSIIIGAISREDTAAIMADANATKTALDETSVSDAVDQAKQEIQDMIAEAVKIALSGK
jgi:hypothetical protein